jgi:epoxyqueuosine reductase QueG
MEYNHELTAEIKDFILDQGADLVGIAPISRFAECPTETHPQHYIPDATCVISFGMKIMDGVCDVWGEYDKPHKSIAPYLFYGYGLLNFDMSRVGNLVAKRLLEYRGFKSLMFPPTWMISQYRFIEKVLDPYVPFLADFSHRHTAVAAGLGEFGFNGLVLVPKYGARIRFNSIITDAPLVPDPMYDGPKLCQPDKCEYKCVKDCPSEALSINKTFTVNIGDKTYEYTKADKMRCIMSIFAMVRGSGARTKRTLPSPEKKKITIKDFVEGQKAIGAFDQIFLQDARGIICGDYCGRCLHGCPAHEFYKE